MNTKEIKEMLGMMEKSELPANDRMAVLVQACKSLCDAIDNLEKATDSAVGCSSESGWKIDFR